MRFPNRREVPSGFTTHRVLEQVVQNPGNGATLTVSQIRERIQVLDALDASGEWVDLDRRLHKRLCEMVEAFPFAMAHRDLLTVINDVLGAQEPEPEYAQRTGD